MLRRKSSVNMTRSASYRLPHRIVRYLCLAMISTVVIFILSLIRMSMISARKLETGDLGSRPPPPPAGWESFEFLTRYYGGIKTLVTTQMNVPEYPRDQDELPLNGTTSSAGAAVDRDVPSSKAFHPYPDYWSEAYLAEYMPVQECFLDNRSTIRIPELQAFTGRPDGFPDNVMGSYELLGLPDDVCFERYGRLGPYGYGYGLRSGGTGAGQHGDMEGSAAVWETSPQVDYRNIDWAEAQSRCREANKARFNPAPFTSGSRSTATESLGLAGREMLAAAEPPGDVASTSDAEKSTLTAATALEKKKLPRTAVVIRTWDSFHYGEEEIIYLRSLISELALKSGGEYELHLLVQVRDVNIPIWADDDTYRKHLKACVPEEFWGIANLWSELQMAMVYPGLFDTYARGPGLPVHGVYRGLQMAIQNFAHHHQEYDFFWHWEMDIRYTGHIYDLFTRTTSWAKAQPRKGLWERNARFYVPSVHGTWEDFKQMVRVQTEMGTESANNLWSGVTGPGQSKPKADQPIWGPERPLDQNDWFEIENDPVPPTSYDKDKYVWGVGEEADLLTFNPMFDPEGTTWGLSIDVTGYNVSDPLGLPPRRAAIITAGRMSRRLLNTMHRETAIKKHHAFSEMWPATAALQHGYKAVYIPHPMFVDREWPTAYMASIVNAGRNGATGGARTSVFGFREHNLLGVTWYYNSGFAPNLWRRWLGARVDGEGGEEWEETGREVREEEKGGRKDRNGRLGGEGRMCLPPMLLHPIKDIVLPVEGIQEEAGHVVESDPGA